MWFQEAVIYQIYPLSFKDSNDDGMGDLDGILEKLDYLEDLGVTAIWLSPIYVSPMADWGYDVADYYDIHPIFGNLATFDRLLAEAHRRGMKLLMDFVPNHTSSQHPWFVEARSSRDNPKRDWYIWRDPAADGGLPNNWLSMFGGPAWAFDKKTGQYYLHRFLPEQPDLNWRNEGLRREMLKVLQFWLKRGVDGFRIDAVERLLKDKTFADERPNPEYQAGRDNPYHALIHAHQEDRQELLELLHYFCQATAGFPERVMISEIYGGIEIISGFYHTCPSGQHAPFNFNLIGLPWDATAYKKFIDEFEATLKENDWPNYVLGNHDQHRLASRLGQGRARLAVFLLLTLRGTPFLYYGDEIGMENVPIPENQMRDPIAQRVPGFGLGRDPQRTPMQWSSDSYAGFSSVQPWLPVHENYREVNVEKEAADPYSLFNLYRTLLKFRKNSLTLKSGRYQPISLDNCYLLAFYRKEAEEKLMIVLNFSDTVQNVGYPEVKEAEVIINTHLDKKGERLQPANLLLRPYEGYLLRCI